MKYPPLFYVLSQLTSIICEIKYKSNYHHIQYTYIYGRYIISILFIFFVIQIENINKCMASRLKLSQLPLTPQFQM